MRAGGSRDGGEAGHALVAGVVVAGVMLLLLLALYFAKQASRGRSMRVVSAEEYSTLAIAVLAREQQAELEVSTDAFESFKQLRQLVVGSVPEMFAPSDELTIEYLNGRGKWTRVKMRTPMATVKAAGGLRITAHSPQ